MNILYCALVMVYSQTPITELDIQRIDMAIHICKVDDQSNGCLLTYTKYEDIAQIKCGKR